MTENLQVPCEVWTRCVGYFQKVSSFNPGKQEEFKNRLEYKVPSDL